MRLLHVDCYGKLRLTKNLVHNLPPYAILSHTWGPDEEEITFDDLAGNDYKGKAGFAKLEFCIQQAKINGLEHFWIDTCCIKKADLAELSEAIASMFRWYRNAEICYVYLSDVPRLKRSHHESTWQTERTDIDMLRTSRWFTRGWTLQELLAPKRVEFFSRECKSLGTKQELAQAIQEVTGIPIPALLQEEELSSYRIEDRISWVAERQTTRPEDKSYCMLGIFDVSMPIIYGEESHHAAARLRSAIAARYNSHELAHLEQRMESRGITTHQTYVTKPEEGAPKTHIEILLDSLEFGQMDARRSTIRKTYASTCSWILKHPDYKAWIDSGKLAEHHGFLWLKGKPGSGKSTLMKFIWSISAQALSEDELLISFFFNARGEMLERTTVGLYRSMLFQLLQKAPDLNKLLEKHVLELGLNRNHAPEWTVELLCDLMPKVLAGLGKRKLKCFIDALDECDERQIREMIFFFEDLGSQTDRNNGQIFICLSSRHYPSISIRYGLTLTLEDEEEHHKDLDTYIQNYLRAGSGKKIEDVKRRVKEKANGVFLWVVLVVEILNNEFERGYIPAVEARLNVIPAGLSNLFQDLVKRDNKDMLDFRLCLQLILFAREPLSPGEYYFGMVAGLDPAALSTCNAGDVSEKDMRKYVLSSSKGLAEITKSEYPTVQFIHESVRDFLVKDGGLNELWPEMGPDWSSLRSGCHEQIKLCCTSQLDMDLLDGIPTPHAIRDMPHDTIKQTKANFPFLRYAGENIFYHANAASNSISQLDFLENFALDPWIKVQNLFESNKHLRYSRSESVGLDSTIIRFSYALCIMSSQGHTQLVKLLLDQDADTSADGSPYGNALQAASANAHVEIVKLLIDKGIDVNARGGLFGSALQAASAKGHSTQLSPYNTSLKNTSLQDYQMQLMLYDERNNKRQFMARHWAAAHVVKSTDVHIKVVELLLDRNAAVNAKGGEYGNALQAASYAGHGDIVRLLLSRGADVNAQGDPFGNALQVASLAGHLHIVRLLLDHGANVNAQGGHYRTALQAARSGGFTSVVKLLLEKGANEAVAP